jgi:hypothetical protein
MTYKDLTLQEAAKLALSLGYTLYVISDDNTWYVFRKADLGGDKIVYEVYMSEADVTTNDYGATERKYYKPITDLLKEPST